ncbi:MAG: cytochrome C oxidase assembly protein [Paracoccaceae bacterium]
MALDNEHDLHKRRKGRNTAVLALLLGFAMLLFAVTIVKLGENVANPSASVSWGESLMNWMQGE